MPHRTRLAALPAACALALALAALAAPAPHARAANQTVNQLTPRGTVQDTDLIPDLPNGAATLQAAYASDLKSYVLAGISGGGGGSTVALLNSFAGVDPTGVTDSTAAIQTALNTGENLYCSGIYKVSGTLSLNTTANHGQVLLGSGATDSAGVTTTGRCVFRPTSALTGAVFKIDGTPFGGYVQSFGFENLTVDLGALTDVSGNIAFNQKQAFNGHYTGVRVINSGSSMRAWRFDTGAYTTILSNTQGNILDFEGTNGGNGVTTITVINHDGGSVISNFANSLKFIGGAYQGASNTKFYLRNGTDIEIATDVEGGGTFLNVDTSVNFLRSQTELQGFSGTYMTGGPAPDSILWDNQANYASYPTTIRSGYFNFNNAGVAGISTWLSGGASANYYVGLGRASTDAIWAIAAATNDFVSGTAAGDTVLETLGTGSIWIAPNQSSAGAVKVSTTGVNTFGKGTLNQGIVTIQPTANTDAFVEKNAAGTVLVDFNTSSNLGEFVNGEELTGYSGNFTGQTWTIQSSNGAAGFASETITGQLTVNANALVGSLTTSVLTVATLPASPVKGQHAYVSDGTSCTFNSAVAGGGATSCPVVYNGSAWVAG